MILSFLDGITLVKKEQQDPEIRKDEINPGVKAPVHIPFESKKTQEPVIEDKKNISDDPDNLYLKKEGIKQSSGNSEISYEMKYHQLLKQLEKERFERELITGK